MNDVVTETRTTGRIMAGVRVAGALRQWELAEQLGVSRDTITRIENDHAPDYQMPLPLFIAWCRACRADPCDVIRQLPGYDSPAVRD